MENIAILVFFMTQVFQTPYPGCDAAIDQTGTVHCACQ